jgi:hypothetical protein
MTTSCTKKIPVALRTNTTYFLPSEVVKKVGVQPSQKFVDV